MKVAIVSGRHSGTMRPMADLAARLREFGAEATHLYHEDLYRDPTTIPTFQEYDLVHFAYPLGFESSMLESIIPPITGNIWHLDFPRLPEYSYRLPQMNLRHIFVDDVMTLQLLGQGEFTNVTLVPLLFDPAHFQPLPTPPDPFTVGVFGDDYPSKRFHVVREACKLAEVDFFDASQNRFGRIFLLDPALDVYAHIHAFAHASFLDTNCLPGMEALACGRPLLTTRSHGIERSLQDGVNGLFYNGSSEDLARKIRQVRKDYEGFTVGAQHTTFPDPFTIAKTYYTIFRTILEETATDDTPDRRLQGLQLY